MSAIETDGLTKQFGTVTAVSDVDLTVSEGEIFGFLGPNGAGKSTTIAMLLDFVRPTSGTASVFGKDVRRHHVELSRRVGVLPEGCDLYDRLSGRKHVAFAVRATDSDDDPDALLQRVGLDGVGDRAVGGYSTGMTQRLKLALALVNEPDLLILDEPSSGLDPNGIKRLREIVLEERDRGAAVFFSSHVLEQVEAVCDRVGIMVDGRLVTSGELNALREEVGPAVRLTIDVDHVPSTLAESITTIPAVSEVTVKQLEGAVTTGGMQIDVSIDDPAGKADVLRYVDERVTVEDFSAERGSLETLFDRYVEGSR